MDKGGIYCYNKNSRHSTGRPASDMLFAYEGEKIMNKTVRIDTGKVIGTPNPKMWGIFYEEINHAGDGGLYAELIFNRNFADRELPEGSFYADGKVITPNNHRENFDLSDPLPGWTLKNSVGTTAVMKKIYDAPRNPKCAAQLQLTFDGCARLVNSGYWGINAKAGGYNGFIIARSADTASVKVGLMRKDGSVLASTVIDGIAAAYTKLPFALTVATPDSDARFFIEAEGKGTLVLDFVSLFPDDTCGVFRRDLLDMLKGMKPGFLRFPGGCVVEGITLRNAIHWKDTVGPIEDRPGHWDLWDYRCTDGLGMLEFCLLGETLDADLMYVCNCGLSCQCRKNENAAGEEHDWWLQNALDGIEYICGDVTTTWGAKRAEDGHPAPFNLRYVEIGNENSGDLYAVRYKKFREVIAQKYPNLELIADERVEGAQYDLADDHYYVAPAQFPALCGKYDGPGEKVYVGEYACNQDVGYGNLLGAISDATFMTHMENCCDRVRIASYAPLFCNDNDRKWPVNLINFDRSRVFGLPSYYVQKLFALNAVDQVVANDSEIVAGASTNLFVTAGVKGDELVIKAANFNPEAAATEFVSERIAAGEACVVLVAGEKETDTNSLLYPENVTDVQTTAAAQDGKLAIELPAWSFAVIRVKLN